MPKLPFALDCMGSVEVGKAIHPRRVPTSQAGSLHAALNAIRLNPEFKAKYEAMVKAGKPAKVDIVPILRKLLILANALIRDQRKWAPANP